ncbi:MAG: hypothetical protein QOF37_2877 [Thermoleophilaceae bacterium]|nr:hypothetical protein [Thermoleophilaceae bacterium]
MTFRLKTLLAVALAVASGLTATTSTASAARNMEIALQDDSVFLSQLYYGRTKALARARQLHVTRIRSNVPWSSVLGRQARRRTAPQHPAYNFAFYDAMIDEANAHGIAVQLALTGPAPAWATGNHKMGPFAPKARYYRDFVKAAVLHFKGRVDRYSIWNEPNYVGWLAPLNRAPALYRALYSTGWNTIKHYDPTAQVLFGETAPYWLNGRETAPLVFLRGVTCAGQNWRPSRPCGTLQTDGFAHHPYDFDHPPSYRYPGADNVTLSGLPKLSRALTLLARYRLLRTPRGGAPDLYLTEYGYFSSGTRRVSQSRQASYLVQAFQMAQKNPRVREMLQYLLIKPRRPYTFFDTSIASGRGTPYAAFRKLMAWARSAVKSGRAASKPVRPAQPSSGGGGSTANPPSNGGGTVCPNLPVQPPAGTPCP